MHLVLDSICQLAFRNFGNFAKYSCLRLSLKAVVGWWNSDGKIKWQWSFTIHLLNIVLHVVHNITYYGSVLFCQNTFIFVKNIIHDTHDRDIDKKIIKIVRLDMYVIFFWH